MCDGAVAMPMLSIVVPTLNEADRLAATLAGLRACCTARIQLIVVDGGSVDDTVGIARRFADRVICGVRGRALQMNAGVDSRSGKHSGRRKCRNRLDNATSSIKGSGA